jgi:hypothetical protein
MPNIDERFEFVGVCKDRASFFVYLGNSAVLFNARIRAP